MNARGQKRNVAVRDNGVLVMGRQKELLLDSIASPFILPSSAVLLYMEQFVVALDFDADREKSCINDLPKQRPERWDKTSTH